MVWGRVPSQMQNKLPIENKEAGKKEANEFGQNATWGTAMN